MDRRNKKRIEIISGVENGRPYQKTRILDDKENVEDLKMQFEAAKEEFDAQKNKTVLDYDKYKEEQEKSKYVSGKIKNTA